MARILYGALITALKGSIGGLTFHANAAGDIVKRKPYIVCKRTVRQRAMQSMFSVFRAAWGVLSLSSQALWVSYAAAHSKVNYFNEEKSLTAMNWFISTNCNAYLCGQALVDDPPVYEVPALPDSFTVEIGLNSLNVVWASPYAHEGEYLFIYATMPKRSIAYSDRKNIRLVKVVVPGTDSLIDITSDYLDSFGLSSIPSSPDYTAKILVCISAVSAVSFIATPFMYGVSTLVNNSEFDVGTGFNDDIRCMYIGINHKLYVGGQFTEYNGDSVYKIIRLNDDGSVDSSFAMDGNLNAIPNCIYEDSSGRVLVGGEFTYQGSHSCNYLCRLLAGGDFDTSFDMSVGFDAPVNCVEINDAGKIFIGGYFSTCLGNSSNCIASLLDDGTFNSAFVVGTGFDNAVMSLSLQSHFSVFCVGDFTDYNGNSIVSVCKLSQLGVYQSGFVVVPDASASVYKCKYLSSNRLAIAGAFTTINGSDASYLAIVDSTGALVASPNQPTGFDAYVEDISVDADGYLVVTGVFQSCQGSSTYYVARLDDSLILDSGFGYPAHTNGQIHYNVVDEYLRIYCSGNFSLFGTSSRVRLLRLLSTGILN